MVQNLRNFRFTLLAVAYLTSRHVSVQNQANLEEVML